MSLWALQQDKSFFQKSKSPMFDLLSKELELTPEQTDKIQERRCVLDENRFSHFELQLKLCIDLCFTERKQYSCWAS